MPYMCNNSRVRHSKAVSINAIYLIKIKTGEVNMKNEEIIKIANRLKELNLLEKKRGGLYVYEDWERISLSRELIKLKADKRSYGKRCIENH